MCEFALDLRCLRILCFASLVIGVGSTEGEAVDEEGIELVEGKGHEKLKVDVGGCCGVGGEGCEVEAMGSSCVCDGAGGSSSISASDESAAKASCLAYAYRKPGAERQEEQAYVYPIDDFRDAFRRTIQTSLDNAQNIAQSIRVALLICFLLSQLSSLQKPVAQESACGQDKGLKTD